MRRIAISDIHSCAKTFRTLIDDVIKLTPDDQLFLLGDYVNRGPDPWGVFDFIFELQARGIPVLCLGGNHEDRLLDAYDRGEQAVPLRYVKFIRHLGSYHAVGPYLLVHAGLNFQAAHPLHDEVSMRWIRNWAHQLDRDWLGQRLIVHGHIRTPRAEIERLVAVQSPILRIDNGCFAIDEPGQGSLCALDLDRRTLFFQENVDMLRQEAEPWWSCW
jgi:serine/threonine protein phosphatase 1